ncbi:hypothetical protein JVT61DRAFT_4726 [Boletus reticuloceps]|uniref:Uncharacterized protein n=1 Tax=Boletus reticuloceps TaxID=495285 RepID=A0A8I2YLH7_9AGAM|nr:hypothetical protein JVT61DRAFT_4726 [Boletus reticuloceps]
MPHGSPVRGGGNKLQGGLSDKWVAWGIRAACEFQLSGDVEAARRGQEQRIREAACDDYEMTGMTTRASEFMRA